LDEAGVDYVLYNTAGPTEIPGRAVSVAARKKRWFVRFILFGAEPVIYFSTTQWTTWVATWFLSRVRRKRVVIALQGEGLRTAWESHGRCARKLISLGFNAVSRVIAANTHVRDMVERVADCGDRISVIPAFIPPVQRPEDEATISEDIIRFCAEHDPVILAIGAATFAGGNVDLYGIDMTVELVDRLRKSYPRIGVLWSLLTIIGDSPEYAEETREQVERHGLEDHWLFSPPQDVFYPVYGLVDLLVRPTATDGDAISVREALHYGVPVVASDAAPRPSSTIEFRSRDQEDFERVVRRTLENLDAERDRLKHRPSDTAVDEEVALLQEVIAEVDG